MNKLLKQAFLIAAVAVCTVPNSGCRLFYWSAVNAWKSAGFWGTTVPIPVPPYFSQQIEDTYHEEERYAGVPILDALRITAKTAGNRIVENAVLHARERVTAGQTLAEPLRQSKVFPPMVVQMVSVGEQTGALDNMLSKVADYYEDEVDVAVSGLTALLEPIMIVFLGIVVGGIVISMYLPIFQVITLVK